jgi:hypothetical protein
VALLRDRGFDVVGDPEALLVPDVLPQRRHPSSVTDAEVAQVAVDLVARLLGDLKEQSSPPGRQASPSDTDRRGTVHAARRTAGWVARRVAALARRPPRR